MYYSGDWVDVGRQQALLWISRGEAHLPNHGKYTQLVVGAAAGVVVVSLEGDRDQLKAAASAALSPYPDLAIEVLHSPGLPFENNVVWQIGLNLRPELVPLGLALLETWQVCAPIWDYERLACHEGSEEDRALTAKVLPDMRMPLFNTRLLFVKRDADTERLFWKWAKEYEAGGDEKHAFLRALYSCPLLLLALPVTWAGKQVRA